MINKQNNTPTKTPDENIKGELSEFLKVRDKQSGRDLIKTRGQ